MSDKDEEVKNTQNTESDDEDDSDYEEEEENEENRVPIDLSENEIYRGVCTLLEDDDGNNILEYISLLHTELIGINKSMEHLKGIRKELVRLADCAELMVKGKQAEDKQKKSK
jgi:hypothetical protein